MQGFDTLPANLTALGAVLAIAYLLVRTQVRAFEQMIDLLVTRLDARLARIEQALERLVTVESVGKHSRRDR